MGWAGLSAGWMVGRLEDGDLLVFRIFRWCSKTGEEEKDGDRVGPFSRFCSFAV